MVFANIILFAIIYSSANTDLIFLQFLANYSIYQIGKRVGMQILVTGASGFVGKHLIKFLLENNFRLTLVTRQNSIPWITKSDVNIVRINDFGLNTNWNDALKNVSYVINLAGKAHIVKENKNSFDDTFMKANHDGAVSLFKAASKRGIKGFLHISSIGVLGTKTLSNKPFDDYSIPNPTSPYAISKYKSEKTLIKLNKNDDVSLVILRPPLIIGANPKGNLARLLKLINKPIPLPLMGIKNRRSLLSVKNFNSAILAILSRWQSEAISGTYVLSDKNPVSTSDIVKALHKGAKGKAIIFSVPTAILVSTLYFAGGKRLVEQLVDNLEIVSDGFSTDFNWKPQIDTLACLEELASTI